MTLRSQFILQESLTEYNTLTDKVKAEYISHVERMLIQHEKAINSIGIRYDTDMVEAGKEFIKQVNKTK